MKIKPNSVFSNYELTLCPNGVILRPNGSMELPHVFNDTDDLFKHLEKLLTKKDKK